jgi:hypothetical protein
MNNIQITLDMLTQDSVSILRQTFDEDGNQVGYNQRNAYMNTEKTRELLKEDLSEDKYNELLAVWGDAPTVEDPTYTEFIVTIDDQKENLINRMSKKCNEVITNGFDTELSDGNTYHFSLEIEDQLKIQALMLKVAAGETILPYHADGELCRYFTAEEVTLLNTKMEEIITYQTTYFNSLREYINSIEDSENLKDISYGMEIPEEYQSEVLKALLTETKEQANEEESNS